MFEAIAAFLVILSVGILCRSRSGCLSIMEIVPWWRGALTHGRGTGRLFGNGMRPVNSGSSADAFAFCARFRIASAAR